MDAWPQSTRGYEADVGLYYLPGLRDIYLDGAISLANPRSSPSCESKAGKVADLWARQKNAEHPVFDRSTRQRLQPFDFCALAFERHGYIGKETATLIRKLATLKANAFELDPFKSANGTLSFRAAYSVPMRRSCVGMPRPVSARPFHRAFSPAIATLPFAGRDC